MPKGKKPDKAAFAKRLDAGMARFGYGQRGGKGQFAKRYGVAAPVVTGWLTARHLPAEATARKMASEFECTSDWFYWGEGSPPKWFLSEEPIMLKPKPTPEQRAGGDVIALQMAVESILEALLNRVPGSASAFLADLKESSEERKFPLDAGELLTLVGIAKSARAAEAADARRRRQRGSGGRKKL